MCRDYNTDECPPVSFGLCILYWKTKPQNTVHLSNSSAQGDEVQSLPQATSPTATISLFNSCMAKQMRGLFFPPVQQQSAFVCYKL